jgi:hypothetical protein
VWVPKTRPGTLTCGFVSVTIVTRSGHRTTRSTRAFPLTVRHLRRSPDPRLVSHCLRDLAVVASGVFMGTPDQHNPIRDRRRGAVRRARTPRPWKPDDISTTPLPGRADRAVCQSCSRQPGLRQNRRSAHTDEYSAPTSSTQRNRADLDVLGTIAPAAQDQQVEDHADKTVEARHAPILAASEPALLGPAKPQVTAPGRVFGTHRTARARRGAVTTTECTPEWIEVYLSEFS